MNFAARTATIASSVVIAALTGFAAPQMASAATAEAATTVTATIPASIYPTWQTVRPGSTGWAVTELQVELAGIGYKVTPTGTYDAQTKVAVLDVQRKAGQKADGIVGARTWQAIGVRFYPVLKLGARGPAVVRLQTLLIGSSLLKGKADGVYGPSTIAAVRAAQGIAGLPKTGIADVRVTIALYGAGC